MVEKRLELRTTEEKLSRTVHEAILPEHFLLADGRHGLILWCVAYQGVLGELALLIWVVVESFGVVLAPVVRVFVRPWRVVSLAGRMLVSLQFFLFLLLQSSWTLHIATLKSAAAVVSWLSVVTGLNVIIRWVTVMNWVDVLVDFLSGLGFWFLRYWF